MTNGKYENKVSLPQGAITNPGVAQTIGVAVLDKATNIGNYSADLIYDPADTDPSPTVTNTTACRSGHGWLRLRLTVAIASFVRCRSVGSM